jgi:hypothetical protein
MGGHHSRPIYPIDPFFIDKGCVALLNNDLTQNNNTLQQAPFLWFNFTVTDYEQIIPHIQTTLQSIGQGSVIAPIYLLTANNSEQKIMDCYLYLPNMNRDGNPMKSYTELGYANRWMRRILSGMTYGLKPYTSCKKMFDNDDMDGPDIHRKYAAGFMFGCTFDEDTTTKPHQCVQSNRAHGGMGIYNRSKTIDEYPLKYYHAYTLNVVDERISEYMTTNPAARSTLQTQILPAGLIMYAGCFYSIISQNNMFFLVLSDNALTLFYNYGNNDLINICSSHKRLRKVTPIQIMDFSDGFMNTRMEIEDNYLNIYSIVDPDTRTEKQVFSVMIASPKAKGPLSLVLNDNGQFEIYDNDGYNVTDPNFAYPNQSALGASGVNDELGYYDPIADYRRRIRNLKAYFRLLGYYVPPDTDPAKLTSAKLTSQSQNENLPEFGHTYSGDIPPYDSKIDYIDRYTTLLRYLYSKGQITVEELNEWLLESERESDANGRTTTNVKSALQSQKQTNSQSQSDPDDHTYLLGNKVYDDSDETPEEKAVRLGKEEDKQVQKEKAQQDSIGSHEESTFDIPTAPPVNAPGGAQPAQSQGYDDNLVQSQQDQNKSQQAPSQLEQSQQSSPTNTSYYDSAKDNMVRILNLIGYYNKLGIHQTPQQDDAASPKIVTVASSMKKGI